MRMKVLHLMCLKPSLSLGRGGVRLLITPPTWRPAHSRGGALHHHHHHHLPHERTWTMETSGYLHAGQIFTDERNENHLQPDISDVVICVDRELR